MAYRFKVSESFDDGVRRIGLEQIDRALTALNGGTPAQSVHDTRKALKRIRALLRLARPGLGSHTYAGENARYRDIGRLLSGARDRHVLLQTAGKFKAEAAGRAKTAFSAVQALLEEQTVPTAAGGEASAVADAIGALSHARVAMARLEFKSDGYSVAWEGIERTYKQAIDTFEQAYENCDDEAMHEWRKRVQHHWRHMALFRDAWPEMTLVRVQAAKDISEMLGEDHDISVMLAAVDEGGLAVARSRSGKRGGTLTDAQRRLTKACGQERQVELRASCRVLGERLFAEPAGAFADRMKQFWASAQTLETGSEP